MPAPVTSELWFVGVSADHDAPVFHTIMTEVLLTAGCADIEPLGSGTAQCRIPVAWLGKIERRGSYTHRIQLAGRHFTIEVDLP